MSGNPVFRGRRHPYRVAMCDTARLYSTLPDTFTSHDLPDLPSWSRTSLICQLKRLGLIEKIGEAVRGATGYYKPSVYRKKLGPVPKGMQRWFKLRKLEA